MYPFQFDNSIDAEYLSAMYENDYGYIEQIFNLTLSSFSGDILTADEKFAAADINGFRRAIHKIKSSFGFTGMIKLQSTCQCIEDKCTGAHSFDAIKSEIESLLKEIAIHSIILRNESVRLKKFNTHYREV